MKNKLINFIEQQDALNISKIAKKAGFSQTLLYGILEGKKKLHADKAFALAKVLSSYGLKLGIWYFVPVADDRRLYAWHRNDSYIVEPRFFSEKSFFEFINK